MATLFGSTSSTSGLRRCVDPYTLYKSCIDNELATGTWWGKANGFQSGLGYEPGEGWILLRLEDLNKLVTTTDQTLVFSGTDDQHAITLNQLTLAAAECITPGGEGDLNGVFLCRVVDRRFHLARIPIDAAYNVSMADGSAFQTGTLNAGVAWTWQTLVDDLATKCGLPTSQFVLPFTPNPQPENLTYWGGNAWQALCDVLDRLACAAKLDHSANTFSVIRLGVVNALGDAVFDRLKPQSRTWDGYLFDPLRAWLPEKVRVRFLRRPRPSDGSSPYYTKDVTLTATTGVVSGSFVQLDDDMTALGATGAPSNSATLATRASERATDWQRKRTSYERRLLIIYRDFQPDIPGKVLGATVGRFGVDDRGGPMRTEVVARPDGLLEEWKPLKELPKWVPGEDSPVPPGATCQAAGFLLDRAALITAKKAAPRGDIRRRSGRAMLLRSHARRRRR